MGFQTLEEANQWIEKNRPSFSLGLIPDAHMDLEFGTGTILGTPTVDQMTKLYKIKLDSTLDGIVLASYDT